MRPARDVRTWALALALAVGSVGTGTVLEPNLALAATPTPPTVPCKRMSRADKVRLDFDQTPLKDVTRLVSCLTETNFMFLPSGLGAKKVTVISSRPVDRDGVWSLFVSALHMHKLKLERRGSYYAILPVGPG